MVVFAGRAPRADQLRGLSQPQPVRVSTGPSGVPRRVQGKGVSEKAVPIRAVRDRWRIDDRWWTETPVCRMYWEVELQDGRVLTLFHDRLADHWYRQRCG